MSQQPDHKQFDDTTADKVDLSNVIPIRADVAQDQQPADGKALKGRCYLATTAKLDFLLAKDIDSDLTPMARRVLTLIMAHRNKDTGEAFPSEDEMARILKVKRRQSITDAVKELVEAGWITKVRKTTASRASSKYGSNHYTVLMDKVDAILTAAEISFTGGRGKKQEQGTVSREDADDQGTVLREGSARFRVADHNGKPCDNQPMEPTKVNPPKEPKGSVAAAQQAEAPSGSLDEMADLTRPPSRETKIELPTDFQADPVAVKAAIDRGCTPEQIERSLTKWRGENAGKRFTVTEWTRKASAWLDGERVNTRPVLDTMGSPLSDDWMPRLAPSVAEEKFGLTFDELNHELSTFRNFYWSQCGSAALKRDWDSAFEVWLLKEAKAKRQRAEQEQARRSRVNQGSSYYNGPSRRPAI